MIWHQGDVVIDVEIHGEGKVRYSKALIIPGVQMREARDPEQMFLDSCRRIWSEIQWRVAVETGEDEYRGADADDATDPLFGQNERSREILRRDQPPEGWRPSYPGDESWRGKGYNPGSGYDG